MKKLVILFLVIFFSALADIAFALPNPATVYCNQMSYTYNIIKTSQGEYGVCILPDKSKCDEWQFLEGKCGNSYSYCIKNGYNIKTLSDGKNSYSSEYAVCVPKIYGQKERNVTDFITIKSDIAPRTTVGSSTMKTSSPATGAIIASNTSLPSSFDWRNNNGNWMTSVKNQGSCGSCWDFSAIGAVEAKIKIERNTPNSNPDLSEQDVISCGQAGTCYGGGLPDSALSYIQSGFNDPNTGVVDEPCFPYTASDATPCSNRCSDWKNRLTKIAGYGNIYRDIPSPLISDIKSYLINKGPLVTYIAMSGSFDSNGIYECSGSPGTNHLIVLVGYNDAGGYWIAKNSWGSTWGRDGNGYFKIYYNNCSVSPTLYIYVTGQINGICNKGVGASPICDGKLPSTSWCNGPVKESCDSVCRYSKVCDSSCGSASSCSGRAQNITWCDSNGITKNFCNSNCQYSQTNCTIQTYDTDGGINPFVKGTCNEYKGCLGGSCIDNIYTDSCADSINLVECYVSGSRCSVTLINCNSYGSSYICSGGACVYSGGGGCPILYSWNGNDFVKIKKLNIHAPEGIDTVDTVTFKVKPIDGKYEVILREADYISLDSFMENPDGSHINYVKLTDETGKECKLVSAVHSKYGDVLQALQNEDDNRIRTLSGEEIKLTFEGCSGETFTLTVEGYNRIVKMEISSIPLLAIFIINNIFSVFAVSKTMIKLKIKKLKNMFFDFKKLGLISVLLLANLIVNVLILASLMAVYLF